MKHTLIALTLLGTLQPAIAQEKLSREEALSYARAVSADLKQLKGTPVATDVDTQQPVVMKEGEFGAMVLPQKGLKLENISKAGENAVPIGQLWLQNLTPIRDGVPIAMDKLLVGTVRAERETLTAPQCTLAIRRNSSGSLELLVFGKSKEPVLAVALKPLDSAQSTPIDMEARQENDQGRITLKILGKYQATMWVTQLGF